MVVDRDGERQRYVLCAAIAFRRRHSLLSPPPSPHSRVVLPSLPKFASPFVRVLQDLSPSRVRQLQLLVHVRSSGAEVYARS